MATPVTKYADLNGTIFDTEDEANASSARIENKAKVDAFLDKNFPAKEGAKRGNPHRSTAEKAIYLWLGAA